MTFPTFTEFYRAVHGERSPFPWQIRLADKVLDRGWSGMLLDLPTGTGKTSALDIALYCLARAPDRMPRRTLLVVDRRIVVDQGADHARKLQHALDVATDGPAYHVANALRALTEGATGETSASCFGVAVMRGGMPRDNDWARRPDMPVLGVSTVDQVGSRLLFRGYGVNRLSASIHAGLVGNDTLILLDEVHLAVPFAQTLEAIRSRYRRSVPGLPDRFAVVTMSATARPAAEATCVFGLDDDDRRDPTLDLRLSAHKHAQLVAVKVTGEEEAVKQAVLARHAVSEAIKLQHNARVVAIVVNRVDTARLALHLLRTQHAGSTNAILVTGRMRPIDRDRVVHDDLARADAGRSRNDSDMPLVVVATQCIEAGADLDFDGLVTECASLDALRQRFGRVDRRGELRETRSVVLGRSDQIAEGAEDPIYGGAIAATWAWLSSVASAGSVDFGVRWLPPAVDADGRALPKVLVQVPDAPVMLPAHLDAWGQTSILPAPDPDIALWLHGPTRATADVQVVWRALENLGGLEGRELGEIEAEDYGRTLTAVVDQLLAVRPSTLESITVPIGAARRWLAGNAVSSIADVVAGDADASEAAPRQRGAERNAIVALRWDGDDTQPVTVELIKPGDILVVDASRGGLKDESFDPESTTPVSDVGDLAQLRGRGQATVRLSPATLSLWQLPNELSAGVPERTGDESLIGFAMRSREWFEAWPPDPPKGFTGTKSEWHAMRKTLISSRSHAVQAGGTLLVTAPVSKSMRKELPRSELSELITEDDDSSFRAVEVPLTKHSEDVKALAERYALALGFSPSLVAHLRLAAWLHDVGKADPRFQRWLAGGDEIRVASANELLAKSALPSGNAAKRRWARRRAGYPDGYRHELLSLAMIAGNDDVLRDVQDPELVLHLVASHHGWCRPFPPPVDDPEDLPVALQHGTTLLAATTRHRLSRLDSGVVDRYQTLTERYGWWGLAWLEAVLRLADHRASEQESAE
ncbi:MAG TPA: type I-U CRISPR-associated helicase/endonuclease Cas3 [Kofleriaceae bacterium]|jgi:CRISPR-associated endonuclease/helicase Cas3|nr:type I-U CRISPR-associated helicase/endonuclease Cas3 [Kofleriaceae bacterium]